jgi:hypothetical protein
MRFSAAKATIRKMAASNTLVPDATGTADIKLNR